jgi:hypothetical protein
MSSSARGALKLLGLTACFVFVAALPESLRMAQDLLAMLLIKL